MSLETYGIQHLSPSSLSLFRWNPAKWTAKYIFKMPDVARSKFIIGKTAEALCYEWLIHTMPDDIMKEIQFYLSPENYFILQSEHELERLEAVAKQAYGMIRQFDVPSKYQNELGFDYQGIKMKGFTDFEYEETKTVIDLKTSKRLASNLSSFNRIQGYLYWIGKNKEYDIRFLFATDKRTALLDYQYTPEDKALVDSTIESILNLTDIEDKERIASIQNWNFEDWDNAEEIRWIEENVKWKRKFII